MNSGAVMGSRVARILVLLVALIHVVIAATEMFLWGHPEIHGRLDYTADVAKQVAPIVANAGLYNGFLAAGLIWGLLSRAGNTRIELFFLTCVVIAGVYGAFTLKWTTLVLQSAPGALAILSVWASSRPAESGSTAGSG